MRGRRGTVAPLTTTRPAPPLENASMTGPWINALRVLTVVVVLAQAAPARANAPALPALKFDQQVTLSKLGDADVCLKWALPARDYGFFKARLSTPAGGPSEQSILHYLGIHDLGVVVEKATAK